MGRASYRDKNQAWGKLRDVKEGGGGGLLGLARL